MKPRARALGIPLSGQTGPHNAITDVLGVEVGYTTRIEGSGPLRVGEGPIRTGVTAILPRGKHNALQPVWAGKHSFNGNGELTGTHWIDEAGWFVGPVCLTNTHSVGIVHHTATKWMMRQYAEQYEKYHLWCMPIVGETYDGVLNDIVGQHIHETHVLQALESAQNGAVAEGNVGGGTGMICYGFKGGSGTASRQIELGKTYTVGAFVQANFGRRSNLMVRGVPVGQHFPLKNMVPNEQGSIIGIIATDAPLHPIQLQRLARRGAVGMTRTGSFGGNGSGDIFLAFSLANSRELDHLAPQSMSLEYLQDSSLDSLFEATVDATEEAILNALLAAESMESLKPGGRPVGRTIEALPHDALLDLLRRYGRLG